MNMKWVTALGFAGVLASGALAGGGSAFISKEGELSCGIRGSAVQVRVGEDVDIAFVGSNGGDASSPYYQYFATTLSIIHPYSPVQYSACALLYTIY